MNKLKIKWSKHAISSLNSIIEFIYQESPANAKTVKRTLISLVSTLNDFPEKYPQDPFIPKSKGNFRFVSRWNYKIVYEVTSNEIIIIDIFHTAQFQNKIENAITK